MIRRKKSLGPIGEALTKARAAAGLTQEELAAKADLTVATISRIERGSPHQPTPKVLRKLARRLPLFAAFLKQYLAALAA